MKKLSFPLLLSVLLLATACGSPAVTPSAVPVIPTEPAATVLPTEIPTSTPFPLTFEAATYSDESVGFKFDYPASWTVSSPVVLGDRGGQAQFTAPDGVVTALTVYRWDPVNDLNAYAEHRKLAWTGSVMTILSEEPLTLSDGRPGIRFMIETAVGEKAFFFLVSYGDYYLELSGPGDPEVLSQIASTIRPINSTP